MSNTFMTSPKLMFTSESVTEGHPDKMCDQISDAVLDACLRGAGFRMGPCELMDLVGHDTNFAVTNSIYEANFCDKRFVPSLVQRELVDGAPACYRAGGEAGRDHRWALPACFVRFQRQRRGGGGAENGAPVSPPEPGCG